MSIYKTLALRRERPGLLSAGDYFPLACEGTHADHVFAFARRLGDACVLVAVPRLLATLVTGSEAVPVGEAVWHDMRLVLPAEIPEDDWRNILTNTSISATEQDGRRSMPVSAALLIFQSPCL